MQKAVLTLKQKTTITKDVYELIYTSDIDLSIKPGQFLLCDCAPENPKLKRSYSVSYADRNTIQFVIKRLEDGTGGSKAICDQEVGHMMSTIGPMGHFVLQDTPLPKVYIGTGTGFAPLYFQIRAQLETTTNTQARFIFGVRNEEDIFYKDILDTLSTEHPDFSYQLCLSRPTQLSDEIYTGYVTSCLEAEFAELPTSEFYICGSPAMVKSVRDFLTSQGIEKEKIFFEQY